MWIEKALSVFDDPFGRLFPDGTAAKDRFF
jgi:hypothetical protein